MLENIKEEVLKANLKLVEHNLVIFTWGNVSVREDNYIIIKPSGVEYANMKANDIVVVDTKGNIVEGHYKPSSDTPTHIELYKAFPDIKSIVHTHSTYATSFAQAGKGILPFGTTHADYFYGEVPCTRSLTKEETEEEYEKNTGKVIVETFKNIDYKTIPAVLVRNHGIFCWGKNAKESVNNAVTLEELAKMNLQTLILNSNNIAIPQYTLDKHFNRKHGDKAYYGQDEVLKKGKNK